MPPTKAPLTPADDALHENVDDGNIAARKRTARSYRTYDRGHNGGGRDDYDDDGQYTPYSDDTFESDYDRRDAGKKTPLTSDGKNRGGKRSDGAARAPRGGNNRVLRQFARGSRTSPGSNASRDKVAQRVQSARRLRTNELKNEIESLTRDLLEMRRENALLRRTQHIQERSLERFEDRESNLPQLLESHGREVHALREQLRKSKERAERAERATRDTDDELAAARKQVRRLQALVDDRQLAERDVLSNRVADLEAALQERTERCKELERHVENLEKNHGRELRAEMKKLKDARAENELLQQSVGKLQQQLKEKEKELDVANIYHGRLAKAHQQQRGSLPALDAPPSPRPPPLGARKAHTPDDSPRDRARRLDERRREALRRRREAGDKQLALVKVADDSPTNGGQPPLPPAEGRRVPGRAAAAPTAERDDSWDRIRIEQERIEAQRRQRQATPPLTTRRQQQESNEDRHRSPEDDDAVLFFATEIPHADRLSREANEEAERRERAAAAAAAEQREAEARMERERFERSERRRLEQEREERERAERERRSQMERAEREQREEEERRARAREDEQRRLASDNAAAEERRKKDMLLRMMRDIDDKKEPAAAVADASGDSVRSLEAADGGGGGGSRQAALGKQPANGKKKEYSFRNADENLHHGVPAKKPGRNAAALDGEPFGRKAIKGGGGSGHDSGGDDRSAEPSSSYAPSFGAASTSRDGDDPLISPKKTEDKSAAKKSKLLNSLFGSDAGGGGSAQTPAAAGVGGNKGTFGDDDIFSSSTKAKPVADRRAYPWEVGDGGGSTARDEAAVLMPRRQRLEPSVVQSKPTVKAISSTAFEDDIEELVL